MLRVVKQFDMCGWSMAVSSLFETKLYVDLYGLLPRNCQHVCLWWLSMCVWVIECMCLSDWMCVFEWVNMCGWLNVCVEWLNMCVFEWLGKRSREKCLYLKQGFVLFVDDVVQHKLECIYLTDWMYIFKWLNVYI